MVQQVTKQQKKKKLRHQLNPQDWIQSRKVAGRESVGAGHTIPGFAAEKNHVSAVSASLGAAGVSPATAHICLLQVRTQDARTEEAGTSETQAKLLHDPPGLWGFQAAGGAHLAHQSANLPTPDTRASRLAPSADSDISAGRARTRSQGDKQKVGDDETHPSLCHVFPDRKSAWTDEFVLLQKDTHGSRRSITDETTAAPLKKKEQLGK